MNNHRVLVVDDSITIRAMIEQLFAGRTDIRVVGVARSAEEALSAVEQLRPDVLTLDIAMPGMDGLTFLEGLMRDYPMPVIMVSSSSSAGSEVCERAMAMGASACFDKARILSDAKTFIRTVVMAKRGKVQTC